MVLFTEQEQALLDLQQVHDNNALIGHIKKPMLSREGTVDSEMLDFATENITTLHYNYCNTIGPTSQA